MEQKLIWLLLFLWLFFFSPNPVDAAIVINEVHPYPTSGNDWIELVNTGAETVALDGWSLEDTVGPVTPTPAFAGLTLSAGNYLKLELSNKLNNTGDSISLYKPDHQLSDHFEYTTITQGMSWARQPDQTGNFALTTATPGQPNPAPTPTPTPSPSPSPSPTPTPTPTSTPPPLALQLSEIMACALTGEPEWVELFNPNTSSVALEGWSITDAASNKRIISGQVSANSYFTFDLVPSLLNNTGDQLQLLDSAQHVVLSTTLPACSSGESFVYTAEGWQTQASPTKGQANQALSSNTTANAELLLTEEAETAADNTTLLASTSAFETGEEPSTTQEIEDGNSFTLPNLSTHSATATFSAIADSSDQPYTPSENSPTPSSLPPWLLPAGVLALILGLTGCGYLSWEWYTIWRAKSAQTSIENSEQLEELS